MPSKKPVTRDAADPRFLPVAKAFSRNAAATHPKADWVALAKEACHFAAAAVKPRAEEVQKLATTPSASKRRVDTER
jgi:hypothetical protein